MGTDPDRANTLPPGINIIINNIERLVQGDNIENQTIVHGDQHIHAAVGEAQAEPKEQAAQWAEAEEADDYPPLPPELSTPRAMKLWHAAQRKGWVDEHFQPVNLSRGKAAYLASVMGMQLGLEKRWQPFEQLWRRRQMSADFCRAQKQKASGAWIDELKKAFKNL